MREHGPDVQTDFLDVATIAGLKELWAETLGDSRICIAVLDGPVDKSHPSFATANLTQLKALVSGIAEGGPAAKHGTHVASVIFGGHDGPVKGIAPGCRGLTVPVFKDGADGSIAPSTQLDLARAITQAVRGGAHIINISGGELSPSGAAHPFLANAVADCAKSGVLIVAAAGNEGCNCFHIPGALPSVLAVGAMNSQGEPMGFSNWGKAYRTQGILAPGENILGAIPGGSTVANSGTSYATPIVSGVAALLLSVQIKRGQKPDPIAVRAAILNTATGCDEQPAPDCRRVLAGRLNVIGAMYKITQGEGGEIMSDPIKTQKYTKPYVTGGYSQPSAAGVGMHQRSRKPVAHGSVNPNQVNPSDCSCGGSDHGECSCGGGGSPLVYALGTIDYDFGTEARRDSIMQHMKPEVNNPDNPKHLLPYLKDNPWEAEAIIWTLNLDGVPVYAVGGRGTFGGEVYLRLREFLCEQLGGEFNKDPGEKFGACIEPKDEKSRGKTENSKAEEEIEQRVSIPGYVVGEVMLSTGDVVPVVSPAIRGMCSWSVDELVDEVVDKFPRLKGEKKSVIKKTVKDLLTRVYPEYRNLGATPQERAINYVFTNIFSICESAIDASEIFKDSLELDTIEVVESPISRTGSEYWDVKLVFFNPADVSKNPRKVYLITVDVSDVVPVTIGKVRSWLIR